MRGVGYLELSLGCILDLFPIRIQSQTRESLTLHLFSFLLAVTSALD